MVETEGVEAKQDHSGNLDEYVLPIDIYIALRKGTRTITYHPSSKPLHPILTPPLCIRIFTLS